ncbi:MAG: FKBP-type peptidyl-prolyl cis-trans isomerase [Bacteroidia bacterium]|nr:FKBP-type peptidyl-prolyl cis-trans isomerase [Bacteroidia bacterium]
MKIKKTLSVILGISAGLAILSSCGGSSEFEGYEKNENGLHFQFFKQAEGDKHPKADDEVFVKYIIKIKSSDSLLADTKTMREGGVINMLLRPSSFKGSLEEAFMMMSKGDSASFLISADSFYLKTLAMPQLPPFLKPGDKMVANIKLEDFRDGKIVAEERAKEKEKMIKQMQEMDMKAKADLEKYLTDNKIKTAPTQSGLVYIETKKGKGAKAMPGDSVTVNYKGMLLDGSVFDESSKSPVPFVFVLGAQMVIPAWDEAIAMMSEGGKAKLVCPNGIAYGPYGRPPVIPQFAALVFEVELVKITKGAPLGPPQMQPK